MSGYKTAGIILTTLGILLGIFLIGYTVYADYSYNNNILYNWNLADKSSTLEAKAGYIDKFLTSLDNTHLAEYDALILKTPDNNIQNNINAVRTLKNRLDEIKGLDPESFAYQTAIQQITAQEQGEAQEMLSIIHGGYTLANYPLVWDWIGGILGLMISIFIIVGITLIVVGYEKQSSSGYF